MKIELEATTVFDRLSKTKRINLLRGGTRSSKSFSLMQMVFLWLLTGKVGKHTIKKGNFIIIRATMPALKATVMKDFNEYLIETGTYGRIDHKKTVNTYTFRRRTVEFLSVDDEEKLKGRESTMFWINEADSVSFITFNHLLMRCKKFCWIDINPSNSDSWIKTNLEDDRMINRKDVNLMISTYKDNPYLNREMIKEIEELEMTDLELYKVYTLGEWAKLTGKVFKNWETIDVDDFPTDMKIGYGLDFGFSNDPTALIRCAIKEDFLYLDQVFFEKELLNSEIAELIRENCKRNEPIVADSAEPKTIRDLQTQNQRVIASLKGKDSVKHGIQKMRQYKIRITNDSLDLITEFQRYKWKTDSLGHPTNEPIDKYNHGIDAARYYLSRVNQFKMKIA